MSSKTTTPRTAAGRALLDWFGGPMRDRNGLVGRIAAIETEAHRLGYEEGIEKGYAEGCAYPSDLAAIRQRIEALPVSRLGNPATSTYVTISRAAALAALAVPSDAPEPNPPRDAPEKEGGKP